MVWSLSKIKHTIKNKFGLEIFVSSLDTKHFSPHIHIKFSGEEVVLDLNDFETLAPNNIEILNNNFTKKLKKLVEYLEHSTEITDILIDEFYKRNPHLKP